MSKADAFNQLVAERARTRFVFYGFEWTKGGPGVYSKLAHSLSEALTDLHTNPGVVTGLGYMVNDAFLEAADDGPVLHVELLSVEDVMSEREDA